MRIILDSNIYISDLRMTNQSFRLFRAKLPQIDAKLIVPKIVVEEVINKHKEIVLETKDKLDKQVKDFTYLTGKLKYPILNETEMNEIFNSYSTSFHSILNKLNARILEYPTVSHETIVNRALKRKKPFGKKDTGYRDTLIWESILSLFKEYDSEIYFVTNNKIDFGEGPLAHPDLLDDLRINGILEDKLMIFPSLNHLNIEYILRESEKFDALRYEFQNGNITQFNIREWINDNILNYISEDEWRKMLIKNNYSMIVNFKPALYKLNDFVLDDVRAFTEGEIILSIRTSLSVNINVPSNIMDNPTIHKQFGNERKFEFSNALIPAVFSIDFSIILKREDYTFISAEINKLEYSLLILEMNPYPRLDFDM